MKQFLLTGFFCFILYPLLYGQDSLQATIVLIGDAGQLTNGRHPVINAVKKNIPFDNKTTIVFLGDNLYKYGMPDNSIPDYNIRKAALDSQLHIADDTKAHVYLVPGNHDWYGLHGYDAILRAQTYIDELGNDQVKMFPRDGCPGPAEIKINDDIVLVMMDSEWWLHEGEKPGIESDCPFKTKSEVLVQLRDIVTRNAKKLVLVAFHHPLISYGPHGGYFTLKQHIFPFTDMEHGPYIPLPILGSIYPLTRGVFGTTQDLKSPEYQEMIKGIEAAVKGYPNVIFLSGHEHTLQHIKNKGYNFIVSGCGSKTSRVSKGKKSLFASGKTGFATLQVSKNKNVRLTFYNVAGSSLKEIYEADVLSFSKVQVEKTDTLQTAERVFPDSATVAASEKYKHFSGLKNLMLGSNYCKEWSVPVKFKVFDIKKEQGGFKIKTLGGGKQSKSLKVIDSNGKEWTMRSVDKDPEKALPENLRGTFAQSIVQDMISASHPYSPLVVATFAKTLDIPSSKPKFFFIPDDPAFGIYRKVFANTVCTLEDRDPTPDGKETKSTLKVLNKLMENNDHHVDQEAVLKARLLDMFIGDFDRHADQWKWGTADTGKGKLYYPVPRDRDQAFFNSNGLLLTFVSRFQMPSLQGFKRNIANINGFNMVAKDFDRLFLNSLDKEKWENITGNFQQRVTDAVIREAVANYPPEIKGTDSAFTIKKLIHRRDKMEKYAMEYYKFISKSVTVTGSNEDEYFYIQEDSGKLKLSVYKKTVKKDSARLMYRRSFDQGETKEIRLYGFNGADKFEIDSNVSSRIKLRIIGGKGNDTFNLRGNVRSRLYDLSKEKNALIHLRRVKKEFSSSPSVLEYSPTSFKYNQFRYPHLNIGLNPDDKLLFGFGFISHTYGFRKEPYATFERLTTLIAINRGAYQFKYQGIFNQVFLKKDILIDAQFVNPALNNFFGFGNETKFDKKNEPEFYRVRNNYFLADLLLRKRFKKDIFQIAIGPSYYYYWNHFAGNDKRILGDPSNVGLDSASIYSKKQYLGGKLKIDINHVNNELLPTRGITWYTELDALKGLNKNSRDLTKLSSDMSIYATLSNESNVTTVIKTGGGHIFTKSPEFFQAFLLGSNNYLRGFRKDRFSGTSMLYENTELRIKLFRSTSYVLPGDVGLLGFNDIARVWQRGERSQKWHESYGGGLYFVPFNVIMISGTMGFSGEDRLFNFTVGTKFNLSF